MNSQRIIPTEVERISHWQWASAITQKYIFLSSSILVWLMGGDQNPSGRIRSYCV